MEKKIIIASHGKMASGIQNSLGIIYGKSEIVDALDCYIEDDFDLSKSISKVLESYKNYELIIITDVFGGSVNNEFLKYVNRENYYLISGLNLPLLIELITKIDSENSVRELIKKVLRSSKETIQFCNDLIDKKIEEETF